MLELRIVKIAIGANNKPQLIIIVAVLQHILPPFQIFLSRVLPINASDKTHIKRSAHEDDTLTILIYNFSDVIVSQLRIVSRAQSNLNLHHVIHLYICIQKPCNTL